jgi:hypothetical protein
MAISSSARLYLSSAKGELVAMKSIKTELGQYREAVRHLWNSSFSMLDESLRFGPGLDLFERIDNLIFSALVCGPLGFELNARASFDPITNLKVVPINNGDVAVMVNRSSPASGYWDDPVTVLSALEVDLALIGFFDWDEYGTKDCRYYRVRIMDCKSHPTLIGRDALIETFYADVFLI